MMHSVLSARMAELLHSPEQQAFEFADIPPPAADPWTPLPTRRGRHAPLFWRSDLPMPGGRGERLHLEVAQDRLTGMILSYRLRGTSGS